jgi:FAD/FMN-containing dehydrogenase
MKQRPLSRRTFLAGSAATLATLSAKRRQRVIAAKKTEWSNWSQAVKATPKNFETPDTHDALVKLVRKAAAKKQTVRVAGSGHSFVPLCPSEHLMLSLDNLQGIEDIDTANLRAKVKAGSKLFKIGEPLYNAGISLPNQGDIDRQALAGAIGTGTHGTGKDLPNMSNFAVGFTLLTGTGDEIECSASKNTEIFKAAQVSFGSLGIMTSITIQGDPAYKLRENNWTVEYADCMENLDDHIANNRNFEFFFTAKNDRCSMKTLGVTTDADEEYNDGQRIGPAYIVYPNARNAKFNEIEFALPKENGPECIAEIRELIRTEYDGLAWPIEYRTVKADDIPLSPHNGRESVAISCHQSYRRPHEEFFKNCQSIYQNHNGRPHWGKMHWLSASEIQGLYPEWDRFQKIRKELDPNGIFMNDFVRKILIEG